MVLEVVGVGLAIEIVVNCKSHSRAAVVAVVGVVIVGAAVVVFMTAPIILVVAGVKY